MRNRLTKKSSRNLKNFSPNKKHLKILSKILRSTAVGLGVINSASSRFNKIKSVDVSPDGMLGGMGYSRKITELRKSFLEICDSLSDIYDCLYDECNAPHWNEELKKEIEETKDIIEDDIAEEILEDEEEIDEEVLESSEKKDFDVKNHLG